MPRIIAALFIALAPLAAQAEDTRLFVELTGEDPTDAVAMTLPLERVDAETLEANVGDHADNVLEQLERDAEALAQTPVGTQRQIRVNCDDGVVLVTLEQRLDTRVSDEDFLAMLE